MLRSTRSRIPLISQRLRQRYFTMTSSTKVVGYVSDMEGNYDYWRRYVNHSDVLIANGTDIQLKDDCHFVCGGDICDRGPGDIRILRELLSLKRSYPTRVHFVIGNRDINKLRLPVSLHPSIVAHPPNVYWVDTSRLIEGKDFKLNDVSGRLKWILKNTMGSSLSFECRRRELEIMGKPNDDQSVVDSYLDLIMPGGELFEYISYGSMAVLVEDTLYVHGGLPEDFVGFVPPTLDRVSQYYSEVQEWVCEINKFAREELESYRLNIHEFLNSLSLLENPVEKVWDAESGYRNPQPGSRLIQCGMGTSGRNSEKHPTVIYTSYLQGGTPVWPSNRATEWLGRGGITKLIVGHQPMGDSPLLLTSSGGLTAVCSDICYSKNVQYPLSNLRKLISLPLPSSSSGIKQEESEEEDKYISFYTYSTEQGILPLDSNDPWVIANTRADGNVCEVSITSEQDEPLRVCIDDCWGDSPPVPTFLSVKGTLSVGMKFQYTLPEQESESLIGKKTIDGWIIKARGIYIPEFRDQEYVQMGISRGIDFKAKLVPLSEIQNMSLLSSWENV